MAFPQGINFRATDGFVSDGANEDGETAVSNYPWTTAQGNSVGWIDTSTVTTRDRNSGVDRRFAGMHFQTGGTAAQYKILLPSAGNYTIRVACGDYDNSQNVTIEVFDDVTSKGVLCSGTTSGADKFKDSTNTEYTSTTWPGSNTAATITFASTTCILKMPTGANYTLAHLYIDAEGGGASAVQSLMQISG